MLLCGETTAAAEDEAGGANTADGAAGYEQAVAVQLEVQLPQAVARTERRPVGPAVNRERLQFSDVNHNAACATSTVVETMPPSPRACLHTKPCGAPDSRLYLSDRLHMCNCQRVRNDVGSKIYALLRILIMIIISKNHAADAIVQTAC